LVRFSLPETGSDIAFYPSQFSRECAEKLRKCAQDALDMEKQKEEQR